MLSNEEIIKQLTQERDDARLAAKMHLRTVECATACLHPIVGQALGPHYDAPSEPVEGSSWGEYMCHDIDSNNPAPIAAGAHYDAPSEEEISDSQELHEILAEMAGAVIHNRGEYSGRRAKLVKFIAKQARQPAIAPAATPAPDLLAALQSLADEFVRVFPIYYYAEPWAHDKNVPLKLAREVIAKHAPTPASPSPEAFSEAAPSQ